MHPVFNVNAYPIRRLMCPHTRIVVTPLRYTSYDLPVLAAVQNHLGTLRAVHDHAYAHIRSLFDPRSIPHPDAHGNLIVASETLHAPNDNCIKRV